MKANSRRRVLISSVAMLLVALVALSTATFAWFSSSTTASANNIVVQTTQASNLLIRKGLTGTATSEDWANSITYAGETNVLQPVSTDDLTNWYTALAPALNTQGIKAGSVEDVSDKTATYVVSKEFQLFYKAETDADDLAVNYAIAVAPDADGDDNFIRVALYDVSGSTPVCVYSKSADGDAVTAEDGTLAGATNVTNTTGSGSLTTFKAGDIKNYKAYVWYEGTDPDCLDKFAATLNNITLTFSKAG